MSPGHDELRMLLGAFVLGGLDDADHHAFSSHLRGCPECQREAAQLSGIPRLLDLADGADPVSDPNPANLPATVLLLHRVRADRRRRRWSLLAAAVVTALALVGGGVLVGQAVARPVSAQGTAVVAAPTGGSQAQVRLVLVTKAWGTQLDLVGTSLPTSGAMALWVVDDAGQATQVATWSATPSGQATLTAACATSPQRLRSVQVRTDAGRTLAVATI